MKLLILLFTLVFCLNGWAQDADVKMKDEKEFNPGQTVQGEGNQYRYSKTLGADGIVRKKELTKPKAKICYETVKDENGRETPLLTDLSVQKEEQLDLEVYHLVRASLEKTKSDWKELHVRLDKIGERYCEQMFMQSISDGFLRYASEVKADEKIDEMITAFIASHPSDASKPRGGWSVAVLDQYHQKIYDILQQQIIRGALAKKPLVASKLGDSAFVTPVRIGDKTVPANNEQPLETEAEADM